MNKQAVLTVPVATLAERVSTLEIGCAREPVTDSLRVDLTRQEGMRNFIVASGYCLPFKDQSIDWIYCYHTLEHLDSPVKILREFRRVSRVGVHVRVPWRMFAHGCSDHKCSFKSSWFRRVFPKDFVTTELRPVFGHYAPFFLELIVRVEWNVQNHHEI